MTFEAFITLIIVIAILVGTVTEGIKRLLQAKEISYCPNILAGYVAIVLSAFIGGGYFVWIEMVLNAKMVVFLIALALASWLGAMVGYDKVVQLIKQIHQKWGKM